MLLIAYKHYVEDDEMVKNNEIKWLEQRFALMRIHLQGLKELQREQQKATQAMKERHYQQRQKKGITADKAALIGLITMQAGQLTELSIEFGQQRSHLLAHQRQEEVAQGDRINRERGL